MASNTYVVEYAKTGRAQCKTKKCRKIIEKSEMRLGKQYPSFFSDGNMATDWYHPQCFFEYMKRTRKGTKRVDTVRDLAGFDSLEDADQELIEKYCDGKMPLGGPATPAAKKPKKKAAAAADDDDDADDAPRAAKPKPKPKPKRPAGYTHYAVREDGDAIALRPGVCFLGRGEATGVDDKRVSRKQLEVQVDALADHIILVPHGVNPTYLSRKHQAVKAMTAEKSYQLRDGDRFMLLATEFPFVVRISSAGDDDDDDDDSDDGAAAAAAAAKAKAKAKPKAESGSSSSSATASTKKRSGGGGGGDDDGDGDDWGSAVSSKSKKKAASAAFDDDDGDDWGSAVSSKPKKKAAAAASDDDADDFRPEKKRSRGGGGDDDDDDDDFDGGDDYSGGKPKTRSGGRGGGDAKAVCRYGASCYRRSADHRRDFWHPGDDE